MKGEWDKYSKREEKNLIYKKNYITKKKTKRKEKERKKRKNSGSAYNRTRDLLHARPSRYHNAPPPPPKKKMQFIWVSMYLARKW